MKKVLYIAINTIAMLTIALLYRFDSRPVEIAKLNDYMDFSHYEICNQDREYDRPDTIFNLIKYDAEFMSSYTDELNISISTYEDALDFVESNKIEHTSYSSLYITRSLWQYIEYAIKDKETLEDYWKIKYYCTLNIGRCNYEMTNTYKVEQFFLFNYMYIVTACVLLISMSNTYAIAYGLFLYKRSDKQC